MASVIGICHQAWWSRFDPSTHLVKGKKCIWQVALWPPHDSCRLPHRCTPMCMWIDFSLKDRNLKDGRSLNSRDKTAWTVRSTFVGMSDISVLCIPFIFLTFFSAVLGIETRVFSMLGKRYNSELHFYPSPPLRQNFTVWSLLVQSSLCKQSSTVLFVCF